MQATRRVRIVSEQGAKPRSKARLSAYGMQALATVAKCSTDTVSRAVAAGELDMQSMESALIWIGNRRKKIKASNSAADRQ